MNEKEQLTYASVLQNDINSNASVFAVVLRSIIQREAERLAETYVSSTLGLEDSDARKSLIKLEYIDSFIDKCNPTLIK